MLKRIPFKLEAQINSDLYLAYVYLQNKNYDRAEKSLLLIEEILEVIIF